MINTKPKQQQQNRRNVVFYMLLFLDGNITCTEKETKHLSITDPYTTSGFEKVLLQGVPASMSMSDCKLKCFLLVW